MGRTTEAARHEFFTCNEPTREWARTLKILIALGEPERASQDWIEIFCVEKGVVDWKLEEGGRRWNRCLYGDYEPPPLGETTGYLIRQVVQFAWDDEVHMREQRRSRADYESLVHWLTTRPRGSLYV